MNKIIIGVVIGAIVIGGGSFYAGIKYAGAKSQTGFRGANFANFSEGDRQARFQQTGSAGTGGPTGMRGGDFAAGGIISKDSQSITVKLQDGGSRIVLFSGSTTVSKIAAGSAEDLKAGEQVTVNGMANQDGSMTARAIQIGGVSRMPAFSGQ